jgi:hypothetical protein
MSIHLYGSYDVVECDEMIDDRQYTHKFVNNMSHGNAYAFGGLSNPEIAGRLQDRGVIGEYDRLDVDTSFFFIYFRSLNDGLVFVRKLNTYLEKKVQTLRDAEAY